MSNVIDQRVVEMQFDNKDFEENIKETQNSLKSFKESLNMDEAAKSFDGLEKAAKSFSLVSIGDQLGVITSGFSTLETHVLSVLKNIENKITLFAENIAKVMTLDSIKAGLAEYETQIGAQQTILMGVMDSQYGGDRQKALNAVNESLAELNTYADKTIYNFTQMTKSIGRFTAQGVELGKATSSVKGIANLAALAGATADQADSAMYMISQSLAQGKMTLYQWRSLENSGLANESFRQSLIRTAEAIGIVGDEEKEAFNKMKKGELSFRESVGKGWLSSDILVATLQQYAGEASEAELIAMGFTSKQVEDIVKMGKDAEEAATKVKTFTQLIDVLKEALQSGWTRSWQIILGDLDEAKEMWTGVSDYLGEIIGKMAEKRNKALEMWKARGGKEDIIAGIKSFVAGFESLFKAIKGALSELLPFNGTANQSADVLLKISKAFKKVGFAFQTFIYRNGENIANVFKGVVGVIKIAWGLVSAFFRGFKKGASESLPSGGSVLEWLGNLGLKVSEFSEKVKNSKFYEKIANLVASVTSIVGRVVNFIFSFIKSLDFTNLKTFWSNFKSNITEPIGKATTWANNTIKKSKFLSTLGSFLSGLFGRITSFVKNAKGVDLGVAILGILGIAALKKIFGVVTSLKKLIKGTTEGIGGFFESLTGVFGKKEGTLPKNMMYVAASIALMAYSLKTISTIDANALGRSLIAMAALLAMVVAVAFAFKKIKWGSALKLGVTSAGLIILGIALNIFALAVRSIGKMDAESLVKGLAGMGIILLELAAFMAITNKLKPGVLKGAGLILTATAINIFAKAIKAIGKLNDQELVRGLSGMAAILAELALFMAASNRFKFGAGKGIGLMTLALAISIFITSLKKVKDIDDQAIIRGLAAVAGIMAEMAIFMAVTGGMKFGAGKGIGLITLAAGILIFVEAIRKIAEISDEQMIRGIAAIAGIMAELAIFMMVTQEMKFGAGKGIGIIALAAGILIFAKAIEMLGSLDVATLVKGVLGITALLAALAGFMVIVNKSKFGLFKGLGLVVLAMSLVVFADVVAKLGAIDPIAALKGIAALGAVLLELAVFMRIAGKAKFGLFKGAALVLIGKAMNTFADSVSKLGGMRTKELVRGLIGMGMVLTEVGVFAAILGKMKLGGVLKTLVILFAMAISMQIFALALEKVSNVNTEKMLAFGAGFGIALLGLTAALAVIGAIPITALLLGVGKLILVAGILIGAMALFGKLEELLGVTKYIELFGNIMESIGKAIGKFIGGIASGIASNFAGIGTELSNFMTNASGFIEGAKTIDDSVVSGMKNLVKVLLLISANNIIEAVSTLLTFGRDPIDNFADQVKRLGPALMGYAESVEGFSELNQADVDNATAAAVGLTELLNALPLSGGILQQVIGARDLASFADDLPAFGKALNEYRNQIADFGTVDKEAIENANTIGKGLVEILNEMPREGGLLQQIIGAKDLSSFSEDIPSFAESLKKYANSIKSINKIKQESIDAAHDIAIGLVEVLKALPESGGLAQQILGAKDLGDFAEDIKKFGTALYNYSVQVKKIGKINSDLFTTAKEVALGLVDVLNALPESGGIKQLILGAKDLGDFSEDIPKFGASLKAYADSVIGFGNYERDDLLKPVQIARAINSLQKTLPEDNLWSSIFSNKQSLSDFSSGVEDLGAGLGKYSSSTAAMGQISITDLMKPVTIANCINSLQRALPEDTFWSSIFSNNQSLTDFSTGVADLGRGLGSYTSMTSSMGELTTTELMRPVSIANCINSLQRALPENNFWSALFSDNQSLSDFATGVADLGTGFSSYVSATASMGDVSTTTLMKPVSIANCINSLQRALPTEGFWSFAVKKESITDFSSDIVTLSQALSTYSTNIGDKSFENTGNALEALGSLNDFVTAINDESGIFYKLGNAIGINTTVGTLGENIGLFGTNFGLFSTGIANATTAEANMASVTAAVVSLMELVDQANDKSFKTKHVKALAEALSSEYINDIINAFINGQEQMNTSAENLVVNSANAANEKQSDFETVGGNLIIGLNNGMVNNENTLYDTARTIADSINSIFSNVWGIHSPSRLFERYGMYLDDGLIIGISKYSNGIYSTVENVAEETARTAGSVVALVSQALASDIDAQPVIRPVLDMSEVEEGAATIGGMFGNPVYGTGMFSDNLFRRNAGAINYDNGRMAGANNNRDVVSAITNLTDRFNILSDAVSNMQMVLDSGELVGRLGNKIDRNLGVIAGRRERGN